MNPIKLLLALPLIWSVFSLSPQAQITIDCSKDSDQIWVGPGETFDQTGTITFENKVSTYSSTLMDRGLHFANNQTNTINNDVYCTYISGSTIIGVHGDGTVVEYTGDFQCDQDQSKGSLVLQDSGKLVIAKEATIDLILDGSLFTRQLWVYGDGTGILELEEGFVADLTQHGTVAEGMGSIRLSNTIFISHSSESLPFGYRPDGDSYDINAHFVFENADGSVWKVMTNPQEYKGGLWMDASMTVETQQDLLLSGVKTTTDNYTNWGGIMMRNIDGDPQTLTKTGPATLTITGDQGYPTGSRMIVKEGMVDMQQDPFVNSDNKYPITYKYNSAISDQNLNVDILNNATFYVNTPLVRIDSITLTAEANLDINIFDTLDAKYANFNGNLNVGIDTVMTISQGDAFNIMNVDNVNGTFANVNIPTYNGQISWDISDLYNQGIIRVASGSVVTNTGEMHSTGSEITITPNPFKTKIRIQTPQSFGGYVHIFNSIGKRIHKQQLNGSDVVLAQEFKPGMYIVKVMGGPGKNIIHSKKLIKK